MYTQRENIQAFNAVKMSAWEGVAESLGFKGLACISREGGVMFSTFFR